MPLWKKVAVCCGLTHLSKYDSLNDNVPVTNISLN